MRYYLNSTEQLAENILEVYREEYFSWVCFTLEVPDENGNTPVSVDYGYTSTGDYSKYIDDIVSPISPDTEKQLKTIIANLERILEIELEEEESVREQLVKMFEAEKDKKFLIQEALTWIEDDSVLDALEKSKVFGEKGDSLEKICEIILNESPYHAYISDDKIEEYYQSEDLPFILSNILYYV